MKKLLLVLLSVVAVTTIGFAQAVAPGSCELASIIQVDGPSNEWPMDWVKDDDKIFSYNVCTDASNIYIRVKTEDQLAKRKMAHFGFTVWMDPNGKKKRKLGLRFPTGVEAKERMDAFRASGQDKKEMSVAERDTLQKKLDRTSVENLEVLELIGLADDPLTSTRSGITNGLKVGIAMEGKAYVYEAVIPFKSFRLSKSSIATLGIGFETGKFVPPPIKNTGQNVPPGGAGGGGYGGGGYGGGGYGGGGYGGGGYGGSGGRSRSVGNNGYRSSPMMISTSAWTSVKLK